MYKRTRWGWFFLTLFVGLCVWLLTSTQFNLGIDLRGGTELRYKLDLSRVTDDPELVAKEVKDIISRRLDLYGLKELRIAIEDDDRLVVTIPGGDSESTEFIKQQIEKAGNLVFQLVHSGQDPARIEEYKRKEEEYVAKDVAWAQAYREWKARKEAAEAAGTEFQELAPERPKAPEYIVRPHLERTKLPGGGLSDEYVKTEDLVLVNQESTIVEGSYIASAASTVDPDTRTPAVAFEMEGVGATKLGDLTEQHLKQRLAIVLDDQVLQAPVIQSRISTNGQITGGFSHEEVNSIVTILRGGSLRAKPILDSTNKVGSVFGEAAIKAGFQAVVIGVALVMVVLASYYLFAGLVANFALVFNIVALLAYVVCFRQTLTLPGIAGILLTIGMAVDANILIYERVREERKRGKSLAQALATGYQRAFSVIFDSNLTTILTGIVLFNFGTGPVKGFAVTLIAGILISFVSALFVTRLILSTAVRTGLVKQLKMFQAFETPSIPFHRIQRPFLAGSVVVILATWALVVPRASENYGIDFTGGTRIDMTLSRPLPRPDVASIVRELEAKHPQLFRDWSLQLVYLEGHGENRNYTLLTRASEEEREEDEAQPAEAVPDETASEESAEAEDAADAIQGLLRAELEKRGLLLPDPFAGTRWEESGGKSTLHLVVNLEDMAALGLQGSPAVPTKGRLQDLVNAALEKEPLVAERPELGFPGIRVESVALVRGATVEVPVTTFELVMTPYAAPLVATAEGLPSQEQTEAALRRAFRDEAVAAEIELSEPFPTVATVGPVVASDLREKAIVAFFVSILGIIFYVSLRFDFIFGVGAIVALVHDVLVTIGILAVTDQLFGEFLPMKINLPEVAALLTIVGYSINDTIVVFDRIRENLKTFGKRKITFRDCIDLSINQTLSRTLWTTATTLLTVTSLLILGGEAVRGFAFTFFIGLIAGTYSTVFIASPVLILLHDRAERRREALAAQPV